jgi:hypothetical protein
MFRFFNSVLKDKQFLSGTTSDIEVLLGAQSSNIISEQGVHDRKLWRVCIVSGLVTEPVADCGLFLSFAIVAPIFHPYPTSLIPS